MSKPSTTPNGRHGLKRSCGDQSAGLKPRGHFGGAIMAALLPIFIFVAAIAAINFFEFGRPD
jgi:hypothetical protein